MSLFCFRFYFDFLSLGSYCYEDSISLLYDDIILGFNYYSIKFINDYIMFEVMHL